MQDRLIDWFRTNRRDLPWRGDDRDSYRVWVSEVMLQQTRVQTVTEYYESFLKAFPDVYTLASASEEDVLKEWEGMGFYRRARNLHEAAQVVVDAYDGKLPRDREQLLSLPGIGPATASAIRSFAFREPDPYLDGNVYRVLARYTGYTGSTDRPDARRFFERWMQDRMPSERPGVFNESLIELGALLCSPQNPSCESCPLSDGCSARREGLIEALPHRDETGERPLRTRVSLVIQRKNQLLFVRRPSSGLLGGLWEFPANWQKEQEEGIETANRTARETLDHRVTVRGPIGKVTHGYSHFRLDMPVFYVQTDAASTSDQLRQPRWISPDERTSIPVHRAVEKALEEIQNQVDLPGSGARS